MASTAGLKSLKFFCVTVESSSAAAQNASSPHAASHRSNSSSFALPAMVLGHWFHCAEALLRKGCFDISIELSDAAGGLVDLGGSLPLPPMLRVPPMGAEEKRSAAMLQSRTLSTRMQPHMVLNNASGMSVGTDVSAVFAIPAIGLGAMARLAVTIDLSAAELYCGRADIVRLLRDLGLTVEEAGEMIRAALDPNGTDALFAVVANSLASFSGSKGPQTVHFFAGENLDVRLLWTQRIQDEVAATKVRLQSKTGNRAPVTNSSLPRAADPTELTSPTVPEHEPAVENALKTQQAILAKAALSKLLPAEIVKRLRHFRRKPDSLLRNPQEAWLLLVRAAKHLDRYVHSENLRSNGLDDELSKARSRSSTLDDSIQLTPSVTASDLLDSDSSSDEGEATGKHPGIPEGDGSDDSFEFMEREYSQKQGTSTPMRPPRTASRRGKNAQGAAPSTTRENYTFVRKHHFVAIAGQYYTVLCDKYTAGAIFDELTIKSAPITIRAFVCDTGDASSAGAKDPAAVRKAGEAEMTTKFTMVQTIEKVLTFDLFDRFCRAMGKPLLTPPAAWESLRESLSLDARELVVKVEEYAEIIVTAQAYAAMNPRALESWKGVKSVAAASEGLHTDSRRNRLDELPLLPVSRVCSLPLAFPAGEKATAAAPDAKPVDNKAAAPNPLKMGRNLRKFVQDRDALMNQAIRHELYDSDATFVSTSTSSSSSSEDDTKATPVRRAPSVLSRAPSASEVSTVTAPDSDAEIEALFFTDEQNMSGVAAASAAVVDATEGRTQPADISRTSLEDDAVFGAVQRHRSASAQSSDADGGDEQGALPRKQSLALRLGAGMASLFKSAKKLPIDGEPERPQTNSSLSAASTPVPPRHPSQNGAAPAGGNQKLSRFDMLYAQTGLLPAIVGPLLHEGVTEARVSGTLILTDRNLYFHVNNKNEVLIIPLKSLGTTEVCSTKVKTLGMQLGRTSDNGLSLAQCEVRRVVIDPDVDADTVPATPLKSLFTVAAKLRGTCVRVNAVRDVVGSPLPTEKQEGNKPDLSGLILVRPSVVLVFSKMKDLLLSRGQERSGGRRMVVKNAIDELAAAQRVSTGFETVMQELVAVNQAKLSKMFHAQAAAVTGSAPTPQTWWQRLLRRPSPEAAPAPAADVATAADAGHVPFDISPWLLYAASGGVTFSNVSLLPMSALAWKQQLTRDRRDEVAFPRRLHLYSAINVIRSRALLKTTGRVTQHLYLCNNYFRGIDMAACESVRKFMLQDDPRWMLRLASWMCHDKQVLQRRFENLREFDRRRFKYQLDTMLDNCLYPINTFRHVLLYIYAWETPLLSFFVYLWLLLLCWHNLLPMTFPISLLLHAATILCYGALSTRHRSQIVKFCTRPRNARGKTLLEKLKNFRDTLASNQVRMNTLNTFVLKIRSLYTWRDPDRTRFFVVVLAFLGIFFAVVPFQWVFTMFLVLQLTKPLRPQGAGLFTIALRRFWDGLPVPTISDPVYAELPDDLPDLVRQIDPQFKDERSDIMSNGANNLLLGDGIPVQILR